MKVIKFKFAWIIGLVVVIMLLVFIQYHGQRTKSTDSLANVKNEIWVGENNLGKASGYSSDLVYKFSKDPGSWQYARDNMGVYMMNANTVLHHPEVYTDTFLQTMIHVLNSSKVKISIGTGCATWLNSDYTNSIAQCKNVMDLIKKIQSMGGNVSNVMLQSVLSKPLPSGGPYPMSTRIKDVQDFAKLMAQSGIRGKVKLGVTDALPTHNDDYQKSYTDLKNALIADGHSLDVILLDVPYEYPTNQVHGMSWTKVKQVQDYVQNNIKAEFILTCTSVTGGRTSARLYHQNVLDIINQYKSVGGEPDAFAIMAWYPHPSYSVPENAPDVDPSVSDADAEPNYPMLKTVKMFEQKLASYDE